ncbi:hypothetical protein C479_08548 [Halovivax asiaticus JCM 14624]|uniref:Uncharacterized protein n=1 Tax=Halovivax asiaticus JCM 14624 TaxID=1227490 RepID=M0BK45_9EURY|nr:hypothetical protein [Halovivax asiaticus]ELZ10847.1 hypothetical protein C479_08548 [Halovivax asiaticus JCM 14624]
MERLSRREVLGASTAFVALSAGCLNDGGVIGGDTDSSDDPASGGSTDEANDSSVLSSIETANEIKSAGFVRYSHPQAPEQATFDVLDSVDDAKSWIEEAPIEAESDVATALTETDYESARAIAIEARAPDGCRRLTIEDVSLEDDELSVSARVEKPDDTPDMCTTAIEAVGAVVRVTTVDDPPNTVSASVRLADGGSVGMTSASDSASASESRSVGDSSDDA